MSKSKGNQYTLRDLLEKNVDPLVLRYLLLATHYRKMLNFTFDALSQAQSSIQRIIDFLYELEHKSFKEGKNKEISALIRSTEKKFLAGLSSDLNISISLSSLFEMIRTVNTLIKKEKVGREDAKNLIDFIHSLDKILTILPARKEETLSHEIIKKIEEREKARKENNFHLADKIRDELLEMDIILEDTREGVRWKKKS
jgi:cysteinyl-tRNA synthetase